MNFKKKSVHDLQTWMFQAKLINMQNQQSLIPNKKKYHDYVLTF